MKNLLQLITVIFLITVMFVSTVLQAQDLSDEQKQETVNNIAQLLKDNYVFPEVGERCGLHIKSLLQEGYFNKVSDKKEFTELLTKELRSISKDKHMRVLPDRRATGVQGTFNRFYDRYKYIKRNAENNYGFRKIEILDGGIACIDLRGFADSPEAFDVAVLAMKLIKNSNAVIFDLRKNGGGSPEMIKFILSYFFEKPTLINTIYWRDRDTTEEYWTNEKVDGTKLSDVPVFVLTSNRTFSGGEEFTFDIQTQKRGVIIGEVTGGGANPGAMFPAGNGINISIPTGTAINPVTNSNWEGVGVKPDIITSADDALDKALELAETEAEKYKQKTMSGVKEDFDNMNKNLDEAEELFKNKNGNAEQRVHSILNNLLMKNLIGEIEINALGYQYLGEMKNEMAVAIFRFNTEKFPGSSNVWDSLGEAYMNSGEDELAIKNYKKSLQLDPGNKNAERMIEKIQNGK